MTMLALVVDDEADQRALLRLCLERMGCRVVEAEEGGQALVAISAEPPHVIVLDLEMPGMGGLEFLRRRRQDALAPSAHVIICSGSSTKDVPAECYCFPKPLPRAAFLTLVEELKRRPPSP